MVDDEGRTWWGVADFVCALYSKPSTIASAANKNDDDRKRKRTTSRGVVSLHRFMKQGSRQRDVLAKHCKPMRMPGTRGPCTPAMRAYGLLRLIDVMRFKDGDVAMAKRVKRVMERLMEADRD